VASQFKNRLVGVTIVVACVVIFLPSIIDGKKTAYEDNFVATPIKPPSKSHTSAVQQISPKIESEQTTQISDDKAPAADNWEIEEVAATVTAVAQQEEAPHTQAAKVERAEKPSKAATAVKKIAVPEKAWAIQLGAFKNAANINSLLKKLHKAGFQAHTMPDDVIDGQLTRVFVGPNISKKTLEKQLPRLKRLTKLQGKLIVFNAAHP